MNWTIEYIEPLNVVKIITEGDFSTDDHLRMIEDIISRDFWIPGMDTFFDHRKLDFKRTTIALMRKVSANHQKYEKQIGNGKAALLMKSLADFARGRQIELMTRYEVSATVSVFLDEEETIKWLTT